MVWYGRRQPVIAVCLNPVPATKKEFNDKMQWLGKEHPFNRLFPLLTLLFHTCLQWFSHYAMQPKRGWSSFVAAFCQGFFLIFLTTVTSVHSAQLLYITKCCTHQTEALYDIAWHDTNHACVLKVLFREGERRVKE